MHRIEADLRKQRVDDPCILQQGHPGIGCDEEVHPKGQHDEQNDDLLPSLLHGGDEVGERVGQREADDGRDEGQTQGIQEDEDVVARKQTGDVFQRKTAFGIRQGIVENEQQRCDDEQDAPHHVGRRCQVTGASVLHSSSASSSTFSDRSSCSKL